MSDENLLRFKPKKSFKQYVFTSPETSVLRSTFEYLSANEEDAQPKDLLQEAKRLYLGDQDSPAALCALAATAEELPGPSHLRTIREQGVRVPAYLILGIEILAAKSQSEARDAELREFVKDGSGGRLWDNILDSAIRSVQAHLNGEEYASVVEGYLERDFPHEAFHLADTERDPVDKVQHLTRGFLVTHWHDRGVHLNHVAENLLKKNPKCFPAMMGKAAYTFGIFDPAGYQILMDATDIDDDSTYPWQCLKLAIWARNLEVQIGKSFPGTDERYELNQAALRQYSEATIQRFHRLPYNAKDVTREDLETAARYLEGERLVLDRELSFAEHRARFRG